MKASDFSAYDYACTILGGAGALLAALKKQCSHAPWRCLGEAYHD